MFRDLLRKLRPLAGLGILVLTGFLLFNYLRSNPDALSPLSKLDPLHTLMIIGLYFVGPLLATFFVTFATIRACKKNLPLVETIQLTIYSAVVNFFGPLQSGPGFRAIYLKKRVGLGIKEYTAATF